MFLSVPLKGCRSLTGVPLPLARVTAALRGAGRVCPPGVSEDRQPRRMQDVQSPFFYHSFPLSVTRLTSRNCKLGADGGLEEERQLLVEEQKLCRSRARRFSQETNQRRRALEERQKKQEVHEQQLVENILKQRRQRVQDATERFQRAHLPPSQRHRQSFRRNVPNIEDALNQIQGSSRSSTQQSSLLSDNFNISRSCSPSPKPPTVSKPSHRQALSAVEAYTKLLQEQSGTYFKSSPQTEETQEKQHNRSPQDSQLSDCGNSESFSSKDSLENEDHNHSTTNLRHSYSSFPLHSEKPHPDLGKPNDLCPPSELTSRSAVMLLGENLARLRKLREPEQQKQADFEGPDKMHVPKASWGFTPRSQTQLALHNCNLFPLCERVSAGPQHFEVNSQNSPSDNIVATNRVAPGNAALDSSCPKQEALLGLRQNGVHDVRQLKHLSATEIIPPAPTGDSRYFLFGPPPRPNIVLSDSETDDASREGTLQQTGKENHTQSSQKELCASINNLNKVSNSEPKTASLQRLRLSNIQSDTPKCLQCPEQEAQSGPVSHSVSEGRFLKGILKKTSKYMSADTTSAFGPGHVLFARQVALTVRDSVELTRTKSEGKNAVKKKLRWFDEVNVEEEDTERSAVKQMKGKSPKLNNNSEDHQPRLATVSGASKAGPGVTPAASTGYHFTKHAWADVGLQVSSPQERADEVKVSQSSTRIGCPRVPRRERSARAGGGPVSSRTRKGTVIRPQSATEVSQIAKTQGNIMVPRPPPRTEWERTTSAARAPCGTDVSCNQALAEQALHKDASEGLFSPRTHDAVRTDSTVMYTPLPPSRTHSASKGNTKGTPSSGHQEAPGCGSRRRGMVCNGKGFCLHCTPTDEEISQLWNGVRSALATKEAKSMLRRQALDSGRVVRKPCVEHSSPAWSSRLPAASQPTKETTKPVRPFSSSYNRAFPNDGVASYTWPVTPGQLHLAGGRARGPLGESDIVAAVETAQTQRPGQQRGPTDISLEEQKILLSLDRLNDQLYYVQAHLRGDTGSCGLLLIDAPSTRDVEVTGHHKHRASSANSRSRAQKRF